VNKTQVNIVTINLTLDYMGNAKIGDGVMITPLRGAGRRHD